MEKLIIFVLLIISLSINESRGDRFTENVANFALESLKRIPSYNTPLALNDKNINSRLSFSMYNLEGVLTNSFFIGINNITDIRANVRSLTVFNEVRIEYGYIIQTPAIIGQYNISGYIGSPNLPFEGAGDYHITFSQPMNVTCSILFTSADGFLQVAPFCSTTFFVVDLINAELGFEGITDHPLLDENLKFDTFNAIIVSISNTISSSVSNNIHFFVNSHLRQDFQGTKLIDILLTDEEELLDETENDTHLFNKIVSNPSADPVVGDRLSEFVLQSILSFLGDSFLLESSNTIAEYHNALFPSNGILTELKVSGFQNLAGITCNAQSALNSRTFVSVRIEMVNVTLSGKYDITGGILGETPVHSTGDFSIVSENGGIFQFSLYLNTVNGHLSTDQVSGQGFTIPPGTPQTYLSGFLDGIDINPKIKKSIVDSIGSSVFCSPPAWCSYGFITDPLRNIFRAHLQQIFSEVSIVDIITMNNSNFMKKVNRK